MPQRGPGRPSKVAQLIDRYDLGWLGAELEMRWTGADGEDRWSLRDLATFVNERAVAAALSAQDVTTLDGEAANLYRLLTDEAVSPAERVRAERRLEREGIDVDTLRESFVSYQAVRTYLRSHRGVEHESADVDRSEQVADQLERLRSRTRQVATGKIERLAADGTLAVGTPHVTVDVRVTCEDCGEQYEVADLLAAGQCAC